MKKAQELKVKVIKEYGYIPIGSVMYVERATKCYYFCEWPIMWVTISDIKIPKKNCKIVK